MINGCSTEEGIEREKEEIRSMDREKRSDVERRGELDLDHLAGC
jgi:hypothetical protein